MSHKKEIEKLIPHRPPFLWVDRIVSCEKETIITEKNISHDLDVFSGHYPDNPVMPGVLLCEAVFQSGALLMAKRMENESIEGNKFPVLTRIGHAKFKRTVQPGDTLQITVRIKEIIAGVCFLKGAIRVEDKVAVQVEFSCTLLAPPPGKSK